MEEYLDKYTYGISKTEEIDSFMLPVFYLSLLCNNIVDTVPVCIFWLLAPDRNEIYQWHAEHAAKKHSIVLKQLQCGQFKYLNVPAMGTV